MREIICLLVTESTNSAALELGEKGAVAGTVVRAETQTSGRGRMNRAWLSPPGTGLYFSIILRPQLAPEDLPKITLTAGLALCKVVETEFFLSPKIKWPNDLLLDGKKIGGILTETGAVQNIGAGQLPLVVIGAGINLFPPAGGFPEELREQAAALSMYTARDISAEKILEACIQAIEIEVKRLERGDFAGILDEWSERDAVHGKELTWITPKGEAVTGVSLGPDDDGLLRVRDRTGTVHSVISGDVKLVGKVPE